MTASIVRRPALWVILAVFTVASAVALWRVGHLHGRLTDDAFITFRYARNVAGGQGWRYNQHGDTENAATSFLWTLVLAVADLFTGRVVGPAEVIFALCLAGTATMLVFMFRRLGTLATGAVAGVLVVTAPWVISVAATEYGLLLLLITGAVAAGVVCERPALAGALGALACFTRGEAVLFVAILGITLWAQGRRAPYRFGLGVTFVAVPGVIAMRLLTGSILPGTLDAKIAQGRSGFWGHGLVFLRGFAVLPRDLSFVLWWCMIVVLAILGIVVMRRQLVFFCLPFLAFAVALTGLYGVALRVPGYHWYYTPIALGVVVLAAVAIGRVVDGIMEQSATLGVGALVVAIAVVFGVSISDSPQPHEAHEYAAAARWLRTHTRSGSSVAATEIGMLGWEANREIIDYLGLLDRRSADDLRRGDLTSWLDRDRPDYWVVHSPAWGFEVASSTTSFELDYEQAFALKTPYSARTKGLIIYRRIAGT